MPKPPPLSPSAWVYPSPRFCLLRKLHVAKRDAQHDPFAFPIGQLVCDCARLFRLRTPVPSIVYAIWHRRGVMPPGAVALGRVERSPPRKL